MNTQKNLIWFFRKKIMEELDKKTGWGKNELASMIDEVIIKVLSDEIAINEEKDVA